MDESAIKLYNNATDEIIKVGDKVKVLKNTTYDGKKFLVLFSKYDVIEVKGDRIVIGIGRIVTAAVQAFRTDRLNRACDLFHNYLRTDP